MSKKNTIILTLVVFVIVLGALLWFYFSSNNSSTPAITSPAQNSAEPFGNTSTSKSNSSPSINQNQASSSTTNAPTVISQLRQIYSSPESGSTIFRKGSDQKIRFIDRANGNVFEANTNSSDIVRLTNTTIPKVYESLWSLSGDSLIIRYLKDDTDTIESYSAKIKLVSSTTNEFTGSIIGSFLTDNIYSTAFNPSGTKIFSLVKNSDGGSYGFISNTDGTVKNQIFSSPASQWLVSWPKDSTISLLTKPSYEYPGVLYFLNTSSGSIRKILGDMYGLAAIVNRDASFVVYSESVRGTSKLRSFNVSTKIYRDLQLETIADKCVWGNNGNTVYCAVPKDVPNNGYPDAWYQGTVSLSDNIWKIDLDKGTTSMIYEIGKNESADIDAMNLRISSDDKYLIFTNKTDLSLWGLKIE
jgi:hypothetical protein